NRGIAGIDGSMLHRPTEESLRMLNVELIERIVTSHQHHNRFTLTAAPDPSGLLPEAHRASWVARQHGQVQAADVAAQFERAGRYHPAQSPAAQARLDASALIGAIARLVTADAWR